MDTLLITLLGPRGSVDLRVPGEVPIGELLPAFLALCGPDTLDSEQKKQGQWMLGCEGSNSPLASDQSLLTAGILNGARLVLHEMKDWVELDIEDAPTLGVHRHVGPTQPATTFHVPVREYPARLPNDEIVIKAPPQVQPAQGGVTTLLQMLLPIVGAIGGSLFFLMYFVDGIGANSQWILILAIAIPVLMITTSIATTFVQRWLTKKQRKYQRETYQEYLVAWRARLRETAEQQQQVGMRLYPPLPALTKNVISREGLWERQPRDHDFLDVSIGQGPVPLCQRISLNVGTDPMIKYEPGLQAIAESLIAQYHHLDDQPAVIALRSIGVLSITGQRTVSLPLVRALLCQIVAWQTPRDVRCIASFPQTATAEWSWLKWLPHTRSLRPSKATKLQDGEPLCLLADTLAGSQELLTTQIKPELELRRKLSEDKQDEGLKPMLPHLVFVVDGFEPKGELAQLPEFDELLSDATKLGVTILCIVDEPGQEPTGTQARITVSEGNWLSFEVASFDGKRMKGILPNAAPTYICELIARNLAPITLADDEAEVDLAHDIRLPDLLNIPVLEALQPVETWARNKQESRKALLRIPLGKREKGQVLLLDLKEAAEEGDGPHGLVVGATGSGKSELLRTLVIGQAILHDPETVNFVFVDFKGGASFADLAALPHVAGMITNLEQEPALVDRMYASLFGELRRRQRMLREAGNLDNIQQYTASWQAKRSSMEPMPHLLLIVDEFAELLTNRPDFLDLFVTMGRVGRSLGLHLLLATQRLEEGRIKGLESYLRYRICLRTFSAAESKAVLERPDAYYLPSTPGVGYIKIDAKTPQRFKTALISVPYVPATQQLTAADLVHTFSGTGRLVSYQAITKTNTDSTAADTIQTEMDRVIARLAEAVLPGTQPPVHQVWLPPLTTDLKLEALLGKSSNRFVWHGTPPFGILRIPIGLLDVPLEQAQVPLMLDFCGAGGHLALVGAPQSGKSTFLRTLLTAFIVTHSPQDVQLYCIDLGGGQLRAFESFPHVGAVCTKTYHEKIRLLIRLMYKVITDREILFRDHNIESMATYRMRRQAGEFSAFPFGDVFLIIDNMAQLQHDFEQIENEITNLAAIGLTYGVHIILASNRWPEIRPKIRDNIGTRLELRLNDPLESEVDRRKAAELAEGRPGRGLTRDKLQFQTCLPWINAAGVESNSQQQALEELIERAKPWKGPTAAPIIVLPTQVTREEIGRIAQERHAGVPIGLEEFRLDPIYIDLLTTGPHFQVLGEAECGKTNLLRLWLCELTQRYTPEEVQVAAIECRATRNLFEITQREHCLTYASMRIPSSLKDSVDGLTDVLKERALPSGSIKELGNAKTWTGPHYFLFVDDYEAIAAPSGSVLTPLRDFIIQAREIGFHLVLTRMVSGANSMAYEPIFKSLREMSGPGLIMSGDRQEGKLIHDQPATNLPAGRGYLVQRKSPPALVQVALA